MSKQLFYTKLAPYYDRIYHYINFNKQTVFLSHVIKRFNKSKNNKILDVACGTGIHADMLQKRGFDVTGVDISKEMINEAKKKNSNIRFIQGDMKAFDLNEKFGIIICFFNSILYNKDEKEIKKTFLNFRRHLERGGILIFDTVDKSIGIGQEIVEYEYHHKNLDILYKPQWKYSNAANRLDLEIEFRINNKVFHDSHLMGAFGIEELKQILQKTGFEAFVLEKDFDSIKKYNSGSMKAVFVCRK